MANDNETSRYMLPDLLGEPAGFVNDEGNFIFREGFEVPTNHFVFFIDADEWMELSKKS